MRVDFVSLFPEVVLGAIRHGVLKKGEERGLLDFSAVNPRDFTTDPHRSVDDAPFGGGPGMVLMVPPVAAALRSLDLAAGTPVILTDPAAPLFSQADARALAAQPRVVWVCGHYEGVDERIRTHLCTHAFSVGDFVVTGGELAAALMANAVTRLVPGVLGDPESHEDDSHGPDGLLGFPLFTRPPEWEGQAVPEVLRSGDHRAIAQWRRAERVRRTKAYRPELLSRALLRIEDLREL